MGAKIRQGAHYSSADLCYNGTNEKPLPLGEVAAKPTERVKRMLMIILKVFVA